jgi:GT2 family glycosyltransferase
MVRGRLGLPPVSVTALLVSHDGARWLPAVLDGLAAQRRRPDRVLAVDTGSSDESPALLAEALGERGVLTVRGNFPDAVAHALDRIDTDWVWILHDDSNPEPGALEALLREAEAHGAAIAGPKLREWPSLRRLLEVGVTISATGRRETGLERGEYDQGQHDEVEEVLAVNTAGMLVRRDVLEELGGFDRHLPLYGNDIDLGWRAARAGHRTVVVPEAVVFHAEAAHRGVRRTSLSGRRTRTHRHEREAALHTLLANHTGRALPLYVLRLVVGTLLRVLGFLLARQPGHAGDEFAALVNTLRHPGEIREARRWRSGLADADPERVRRLLAPWWLPYRHGLDAIGDFASATVSTGRDAAERRRAARAPDTGPVADEADELEADSGLLARVLLSPIGLVSIVVGVLTLWGAREALGPLSGGALSPAPGSAGDWWRLATEGWHTVGQGTSAPAPGYLLPFAAAAALPFSSPTVVVSLLFLLAVPLSGWGAWRFLRLASELGVRDDASRLFVACGALAYAAVPVASGAWGQGRFGVVASAVLLPWLAHAACGLFEPSVDRRWRAAWRSGLLLAVMTAFTPSAWLVALFGVLLILGLGLALAPSVVRDRTITLPLVVAVAVPPVLLLPGALGMLGHDVSAMFLEAGRLAQTPGPWDFLGGRVGDPAAPLWLGLMLLPAALAALALGRTRTPVVAAWCAIALAAVVAAVLSRVDIDLPAGVARPGLGFLVVLVQGCLVAAIVVAAHGLRREETFLDWRRPVAVVLGVGAMLAPLGGLGWWLVDGDDQLHRPGDTEVPAYMLQGAEAGAGNGVLLLAGDVEEGLSWQVHRGDGVTLGEDEILALTGPDADLDRDVTRLVSDPTSETAAAVAGHGIDYLLLTAPVDDQVAATLDATPGLSQASADRERLNRAWHLDAGGNPDALEGEAPWWHGPVVVLQLVAIVVVAVLCGPARRESE